ncbi:MAG: hypothetical protein ABSF44_04790 [Candidatus Bathyarchaeia archaeon]
MERLKNPDQWGTLVIVLFTICLSALIIVYRSLFSFSVGSLLFTHWAVLIGGFWIAVVTPIYVVLKHRRPTRIKAWVRVHILGNLVAFTLISVHFTYWITRVSFIGTGFALFVATLTLVVTGLFYRFNIMQSLKKYIRFVHVSMTTAFYLILTIHILSHMMRL